MAKTLASALPEGDAIYRSSEWSAKRDEYSAYRDIYDGAEWGSTTGQADPDSGGKVLRYPLQVNPPAKCCRIHRAVMFGMRGDSPSLPVKALVPATEGPSTEDEVAYQRFINSTWLSSDGIALMEESGLLLQIYGGHFFKVAWEFWNELLPHRIAVRSFKSPGWCLPVYDIYDPWNLLEAWVGYEIPTEVAKLKYSITPREERDHVLYLEHWTRETWRIEVDGQVPTMQVLGEEAQQLAGENPWGVVPIVYIPHERDGDFYGRSLVATLPGLSRELNAREADIGDATREQTHRRLVGRNIRTKGAVKARKIVDTSGRFVEEFIDIGEQPPLQHSTPPNLDAIKNPGLPESVMKFPALLWDEIRRQADVAAVAMGDDDVSGGRITGPVTAYRMWPTISHTMTERANYSTGLNHVARIMATIAEEREASGQYDKLKVKGPGVTKEMIAMPLRQTWHGMIPIEQLQKVEILNARLQAGGVSLHTYLSELQEDNVDEEEARIWADLEKKASIKAKHTKPVGGSE